MVATCANCGFCTNCGCSSLRRVGKIRWVRSTLEGAGLRAVALKPDFEYRNSNRVESAELALLLILFVLSCTVSLAKNSNRYKNVTSLPARAVYGQLKR